VSAIKISFSTLLILLASLVLGCSGGNKLIDNRAGEIGETRIVSPDSIPGSYSPMEYRLDYGDIIDVKFLYNDEYSMREIKVRPDGMITYPYVGEVKVGGRTVPEVDSILTARFSEILRDPDISIIHNQLRRLDVYVLGEVTNPGAFRAANCKRLLDALSMSRGLTDKAKRNGVIVIRKISPHRVVGIQVDVQKIIDGKRYDYNIPLEPMDIVLVPKSKVGKVSDLVESITGIFKEPVSIYESVLRARYSQAMYDYWIVRNEE